MVYLMQMVFEWMHLYKILSIWRTHILDMSGQRYIKVDIILNILPPLSLGMSHSHVTRSSELQLCRCRYLWSFNGDFMMAA